MARGDFTLFQVFAENFGDGEHDLSADTLKLGFITDSGTIPAASTATPTWSDFSAADVSAAGNYNADGETLTSVTYSQTDGVATLDAADVVIQQDDTDGFTDASWAILYNDTNATDMAIGFIDLGADVSERDGDVTVSWHADGIFTVDVT